MSVKTAFNISSISGKLDTAKSKLQEAISVTSQIMSHINFEEPSNAEGGASSSRAGVFHSHFDRPEFPQHVVLDYTTKDQNGEPVTAEGRLMRTVITLSRGGETCGVSAVGSLGMGGVGKTIALRALRHAEKVKEAYPDGIWFMEFGEDASDEKVAARIRRCVENSGGSAVAKEMTKTKKLCIAIELASAWLRRRKILLVCDDLWQIKAEDVGYVRELKTLLED